MIRVWDNYTLILGQLQFDFKNAYTNANFDVSLAVKIPMGIHLVYKRGLGNKCLQLY
jgi:hypothetical protein